MMLRPASMYDNVPSLPAPLSAYRQTSQTPGSPAGGSLKPPSHQPSLNDINLSELSADRLNLYADRHDAENRMLEQIDEEPGPTFRAEARSRRQRWKRNIRIIAPHIGLVILSALYTVFGATVFHHIEQPYEIQIRNDTSQRVYALKRRIIAQLWTMVNDNTTLFDDWSLVAHTGMNMVIKDVFIDYTKNYMLPEDIINGTGPMKWSIGSSIFFSWTCITTIGYGHIVPRTLEGRIFCLAYALIGIPLILVTIADLGRFLSGGIIWTHKMFRKIRRHCFKQCSKFCYCLCCSLCDKWKKRKRQSTADRQLTSSERKAKLNHFPTTRKFVRKQPDQVSEAGTFEDISEIHTQGSSDKSTSEDTKARADELEDYEPIQQEHRVSLIFILVIMLCKLFLIKTFRF